MGAAVRLEVVLSEDGLDFEVAFRPLHQGVGDHNRVQVVVAHVLGRIHLEVLEVAREDRTQVLEAGLSLEEAHREAEVREDRNLDLEVVRAHRMASEDREVVVRHSQDQAGQVEVLDGDRNLVQEEALAQGLAVVALQQVGRAKVLDDLVATLMTGPVRRGRCCCHRDHRELGFPNYFFLSDLASGQEAERTMSPQLP